MKNNNINDLKSDNLKGNIKSIETVRHIFTEKNGELIRNMNYDQDKKSFSTYYKSGQQINNLTYNSLGQMVLKLIWEYDAKGNKLGNKVYCFDDSLITESTYKYKEKNTLIEKIDDTKIIYKYNSKGYLIEELCYDAYGQLQSKFTYEYDIHGNEITWIFHDDLLLSKITYQYDNGNIVRENVYSTDGILLEDRIFKYEFDSLGNWVKKIEKLIKELHVESTIVSERTIIYY